MFYPSSQQAMLSFWGGRTRPDVLIRQDRHHEDEISRPDATIQDLINWLLHLVTPHHDIARAQETEQQYRICYIYPSSQHGSLPLYPAFRSR